MRAGLIATIAAAALVLTGCDGTRDPVDEPNAGTNGPIVEETVTLRDGSTVTCLTYDRSLDCDWSDR